MSNLFRSVDNMLRRSLEDTRFPLGWGHRVLPASTAGSTEPASGSSALPAATCASTLYPAVDCFARDKQLVIRAELPGVDPNHVEVCVAGDRLVIRGEKKATHKVDEGDYFFQEVGYGRCERTFTLPDVVKSEDVKASFSNGVLEITVPAEGMKVAKKVPIEIARSERKSIKAG